MRDVKLETRWIRAGCLSKRPEEAEIQLLIQGARKREMPTRNRSITASEQKNSSGTGGAGYI